MTDTATETPIPVDPLRLRELTAEVVSAYVAHNSVPSAALAGLIGDVYATLAGLGTSTASKVDLQPLSPAVPVKKSVHDDHLISLVDGSKLKSLKRHLSKHGFTPDSYRAAYGLPADYPMVAPAYGRARSQLAKDMGLGQQRRTHVAKPAAAAA